MNNFNEEFKKMIVEMYENGESVSNLSKEYEVSRPTIYNWIKHYKIIETVDGETTGSTNSGVGDKLCHQHFFNVLDKKKET